MEGCKALQHHSELVVPVADIYVHGAKALVAAVLAFASLGQRLEVEPILNSAKGNEVNVTIRKG